MTRPSWSAPARCFLAPQNLCRRRRVTTVAVVVFFFLLLPPSLPMVGYMYLALSRVQTPHIHTKSSLTHFRVLLKVLRGGLQFFPRDVIISRPPFNISSSWLAV